MLAKPRVEQVACLLGQSLRTGRWSPPTPDRMHVDTKLCVCVCLCVCVRARARARYGQSAECADLRVVSAFL